MAFHRMLRVKLPAVSASSCFVFTFAYREYIHDNDDNNNDNKQQSTKDHNKQSGTRLPNVRVLIEDGHLCLGTFNLDSGYEIEDSVYENEMNDGDIDAFYASKRPQENGRWKVKLVKQMFHSVCVYNLFVNNLFKYLYIYIYI